MSTKIIRYFAFPVQSVFLVKENDYKVQDFTFPTYTKCLLPIRISEIVLI